MNPLKQARLLAEGKLAECKRERNALVLEAKGHLLSLQGAAVLYVEIDPAALDVDQIASSGEMLKRCVLKIRDLDLEIANLEDSLG